MVSTRRTRQGSALGDSWVVSSVVNEDAAPEEQEDSAANARPRAPARNARNAREEPQLVMPLIAEEPAAPPPPPPQPRRRAAPRPSHAAARYRATAPRRTIIVDPATLPTGRHVADDILAFVGDVLRCTFKTLRTPLAYMLAVYLVFGLMVFVRNMLFERLSAALSPICRLPGLTSIIDLPFCHHPAAGSYAGAHPPPAEFDRLAAVQTRFEDLLLLGAEGIPVPVHMRRSELAIRDLRAVVRHSGLASRGQLALEFDAFVDGAKDAALAYQRFTALAGRAVDRILPAARTAARTIARDRDRAPPHHHQSLAGYVSDALLAPFRPLEFGDDVALAQYLMVLQVTRREVQALLGEAQTVLAQFERLEDALDAIHAIAVRDAGLAEAGRDDVLAQLWTRLGANRNRLFEYDRELRLLAHVGNHRRTAITHLGAAITELQGMNAELEDLDERVRTGAEAQFEGAGAGALPLEIRLESLERGVARLDATNQKARQLRDEFSASKERKLIWEAELDRSRLIEDKRSRP